jgi:hypothetical protein
MKSSVCRFFFLTTSIILPTLSFGKTFKSSPFIRFELPPNWDCKQEEAADWVCQSDNIAERSEAIVVVVTKEANEVDDTLDKYEEYLKIPREMRDLVGNPYKSEVKFTRRKSIIDQEWIDSLHLGSEIPGFYTRYVATTKEKIAGLITYSVAESSYPKYATLLDRMIDSAQIYFDPKAFEEARNAGPTSLLGARNKNMKSRMDPTFEGDKAAVAAENQSTGEGLDNEQIFALLFLVAVVGYVIYKRKKRA